MSSLYIKEMIKKICHLYLFNDGRVSNLFNSLENCWNISKGRSRRIESKAT